MSRLINLTPHEIRILLPQDGPDTSPRYLVLPSAGVARSDSRSQALPPIEVADGLGTAVPLSQTTYGAIVGLPDPQPGVVYVTSAIVAEQAQRDDVVAPGTGPADGAVREDGRVVAVTRLVRVRR